VRSVNSAACHILLALVTLVARPAWSTEAEVRAVDGWQKTPALTVRELTGFTPGAAVPLSRYGGWTERKFRGSGFFRTERAADRWWLVDPEGCAFLSVGLCSVNLGTFDPVAVHRTFTNEAAWASQAAGLLRSAGFNTLGRWSKWEAFRPQNPIPYTTTLSLMHDYARRRPPANGERGYPSECMPVFDPEFPNFCDRAAAALAATKNDPWLLGHFTDNELPFRPDSLTNFLALPSSDVGHQAARRWLAERGSAPDRITSQDEEGFLTETARRYYATVVAAIRKHDPNHLVIGSRIHGLTICPAVLRGSTPLDVVSVNYYHRWSPEPERMAGWVKLSGRPFLISEWYAMSVAPDQLSESGAGFRVRADADRGLFYQNMALGLLRDKGCIGWHWFKYGGDQPGVHMGVVSPEFAPHEPLLRRMKELNMDAYRLADHLQAASP
jgi:hypothetical protein